MNNEIFFKLTESVAQKLIESNLSKGAVKLWLYLITKNPNGDREEPLVFELIERDLGFSKSEYYRARAELQKKEFIEFVEGRTTFKPNLINESQSIESVSKKENN